MQCPRCGFIHNDPRCPQCGLEIQMPRPFYQANYPPGYTDPHLRLIQIMILIASLVRNGFSFVYGFLSFIMGYLLEITGADLDVLLYDLFSIY